jgi:hypothetical protein
MGQSHTKTGKYGIRRSLGILLQGLWKYIIAWPFPAFSILIIAIQTFSTFFRSPSRAPQWPPHSLFIYIYIHVPFQDLIPKHSLPFCHHAFRKTFSCPIQLGCLCFRNSQPARTTNVLDPQITTTKRRRQQARHRHHNNRHNIHPIDRSKPEL